MLRPPDRQREDTSNIVLLEHVNLQIADQQLATLFYVSGLQLTREPYLMVGLDNMWINVGRTQLHLPTCSAKAQRLRGRIGLVLPELGLLEHALAAVAAQLTGTCFGFRSEAELSRKCRRPDRYPASERMARCSPASRRGRR
jgi:hypothetical protein